MTESALSTRSPQKFTLVEDVWLLAVGYSVAHGALLADLAARNAEMLARLVSAQPSGACGCKPAMTAIAPANLSTAEEFLALDQRRTECRALGSALDGVMMPLRRDLILMSSVVC
jgi:hypothetical protein